MSYDSWTAECSAARASLSARAIAQPPKPPPVMRAPQTPSTVDAAEMTVSNSGHETAKSLRKETCDSIISRPKVFRSPASKASAAPATRAFSVTTCLVRLKRVSSSSCSSAESLSMLNSRNEPIDGATLNHLRVTDRKDLTPAFFDVVAAVNQSRVPRPI